MPPAIIIADSDDEEDEGYSPHRGLQTLQSPRTKGLTPRQSVDYVSHTTSSTDPTFFQTVYDEQVHAARGNMPEAVRDEPGAGSLPSSEVTDPASFQPVVTTIIDTSSLTSITDPGAAGEHKGPNNKVMADWTQISTPGRKKAPVADMGDPWDVPSSPEEQQNRRLMAKPRLKRKDKEQVSQSLEESRKPPRQSKSVSHVLAEANPNGRGPETYCEASPDGRKRRKIDYSQDFQGGSNEVDLVALPLTNENPVAERLQEVEPNSSMFPPTLPAPSDRSFYVAARALTDSQKLEYESVQLDSSDHRSRETMPPIRNIDIQLLGSSGSATNVNTPRSDIPLSHSAPPPEPTPSIRTTAKPPPRFRRTSSPDVLVAIEPSVRDDETEFTAEQKHEILRDSPDELSEKPDVTEPLTRATIANDEDSDYTEKPAKPKNPRGRPRKQKKTAGGEATQQAAGPTAAVSQAGDGEPGLRTKKKRGRPRKSGKPAIVDKSPQFEAATADDAARVENQGSKIEAESGTQAVGDQASSKSPRRDHQNEQEGSSAERKVEARTPAPDTDREQRRQGEGEANTPKKTNPDAVIQQTKSEQKAMTGTKMGLAVGSKPLFRVGLSKRSRIAPLLKSLRK